MIDNPLLGSNQKLPYCLVTEHPTYYSVTRDYLQPSFLASKKTKKTKTVVFNENKKIPLAKRNKQIFQLGMSCKWKTFITLTFAPENYPPDNNWADYDKIQIKLRSFTRALKYRYPDLKYLGVLEHGSENNRKHFHLLTNIEFDEPIFINFMKKNRKICPLWQEGFSDVVKVHNKYCNAVFYLLKYLEKSENCRTPIGKREVFASRGLGYKRRRIVHETQLFNLLKGAKYYDTYYKSEIYVKNKKL